MLKQNSEKFSIHTKIIAQQLNHMLALTKLLLHTKILYMQTTSSTIKKLAK
jgi:hypothetical protein